MNINPKTFLIEAVDPKIKDELKERTEDAFNKGVFGAPTFIINNNSVRVINEDNQIKCDSSNPHPHATIDSICFGEMNGEANRMLGEMKWYDLVKLLYSWSISYYPEGTPYRELECWTKHYKLLED